MLASILTRWSSLSWLSSSTTNSTRGTRPAVLISGYSSTTLLSSSCIMKIIDKSRLSLRKNQIVASIRFWLKCKWNLSKVSTSWKSWWNCRPPISIPTWNPSFGLPSPTKSNSTVKHGKTTSNPSATLQKSLCTLARAASYRHRPLLSSKWCWAQIR